MQFKAIIVALFAGAAIAIPTGGGSDSSYVACEPGLYGNPQCCATDVLGVADLDCHSPGDTLRDASHFRRVCADVGQRARCCVVPILGQALLCKTPTGV